MRNKVSFK